MNCRQAIPLVMSLAGALATTIHALQSSAITGNELMRRLKIVFQPVESSAQSKILPQRPGFFK